VQKIKITSQLDPYDAAVQQLARIRRDLYARASIDMDPDNPAHRFRRDADGHVYFEFSADSLDEIRRTLNGLGYVEGFDVSEGLGAAGDPCLRCGYIAGEQGQAVCARCGFQEISPCPHCNELVARRSYIGIEGDLARCPRCQRHVRLRFNEPLLRGDGEYNEPVIIVDIANEAAA
jgi:hypothetical protein